MNEGNYFGEVALMTNLRRTCSIYSVNNCYFGLIEKKTFIQLVENNFDLKYSLMNKINSYKDELFNNLTIMINNVPAFRNLPKTCIRKIVQRLK